jgi:nucleoside-diphosphate-sugar epimerase
MGLITVIGGSGFIGSALLSRLRELKLPHWAPGRGDDLAGRPLGSVFFCAGVTADFRTRPLDAVDAHVCHLLHVLRECDLESVVYLSSVRVYGREGTVASEEDVLRARPSNPAHLYDLSKMMGESLALSSGKKVRVVRLANVYGHDFMSSNFLSSVIKQAILKDKITLQSDPRFERDYIAINDVVDGLMAIATAGTQRVYNLASGVNVSNETLIARIREITGCGVSYEFFGNDGIAPLINISRIQAEFDMRPRLILDDLAALIESYRKHAAAWMQEGGRGSTFQPGV